MKSTYEKSLHFLVEKWLAPTSAQSVHVMAFGRTSASRSRYVYIKSAHAADAPALFFFRHYDGCWKVYPPEPAMPVMTAERLAA